MIKVINYPKLFEWFKTCPELQSLMTVAGQEDAGARVIFPLGASESRQFREWNDVNDEYRCEIVPYPSIYEEFQINCYEWYDAKDESDPHINVNVLSLEEVTRVCQWIEEQDRKQAFPDVGENIIAIDCVPITPQIQYINAEESLVGYFITVRVRYINKRQKRVI